MFPQHRPFSRLISLAAVFLLLGGAGGLSHFAQAKSHTSPREYISGRVVGVADGDTITVLADQRGTKIRLYGVDSPEKKQAFGNRAKQFTSSLVFDQNVQVEVVSTDRYQRRVGVVTRADGMNLNEALLENGYAWWYEQYAKKEKRYADLERRARDRRVGLWSDKNPTPPWKFRQDSRLGRQRSVKAEPIEFLVSR
jgi:endonuclease YncB( thermonuclease family)